MARKLVDTKTITHEQWLETRKSSVGGSEAASCIGMNEYCSALALYAEKKGLTKPFEGNGATELGNALEDFVAQKYMEQSGNKVRNDFFMYQDDEFDFITANVDRRIIGENAGLECKTMGRKGTYDLENGEIPAHYYCQCQHYMMVLGFDYMDIAIYVLQDKLYINRINRDDDFIAQLRAAEVEFWKEHVEKDEPPAPDGTDSSLDALQVIYADTVSDELSMPELDDDIARYRALKDQEKELKAQIDELKATLSSKLGEHEVCIALNYGCSWKPESRTYVDNNKLKTEYPDVYEKVKYVSTSRTFRTKKIKK